MNGWGMGRIDRLSENLVGGRRLASAGHKGLTGETPVPLLTFQEDAFFGGALVDFQDAGGAGVSDAVNGGDGGGFGVERERLGGCFGGEDLGLPVVEGFGLHHPPADGAGVGSSGAPVEEHAFGGVGNGEIGFGGRAGAEPGGGGHE